MVKIQRINMKLNQWWISKKLISAAYRSKKITNLPASIVASQAILETGWLKYIPKDINTGETSNNLFGIKARENMPHVTCITHEYYNGVRTKTFARFRKYKNYEESFIDYGKLILENPRYKKAVEVKDDPRAYIKEIVKAGYCTAPDYVRMIIIIAENCKFIPKKKVES